jgi:beta-lactamase class D
LAATFGKKEMKPRSTILLWGMPAETLLTSCGSSRLSASAAKETFGDLAGALVVIECSSGYTTTHQPDVAGTRLPPCSTFKIGNAIIGLETGIIASPDEQFYQWDGVKRSIPAWNRDLTLREAFQASCVPAFQKLTRRIGPERMQSWIDKIGYGNQDISAGKRR